MTFGAGDTSRSITVPTTQDTVDEPNETFRVDLGAAGGGLTAASPTQLVVTVVDDDAPLRPTKVTKVKQKGTSSVSVTFSLPAPGGYVVDVTDPRLVRDWGERVAFTKRPGARTITVKLKKAARTTLRKKGRLRVKVVLYFEPDGGGKAQTSNRSITLKRR